MMMNKRASIERREKLWGGDWLYLEKIIYRDSRGGERCWEGAARTGGRGAVAMLALLEPSRRLILIRQFRPPAGRYVIEFPAGLIDSGENPEICAIRELREETGYLGECIRLSADVYNSPGLSGETVYLAWLRVDERIDANLEVRPQLEDGEEIETILVPLADLETRLAEYDARGDGIDAKLAAFAVGRSSDW